MRILHGSLVLLIGLLSVSQSGVRSADDATNFAAAQDAVANGVPNHYRKYPLSGRPRDESPATRCGYAPIEGGCCGAPDTTRCSRRDVAQAEHRGCVKRVSARTGRTERRLAARSGMPDESGTPYESKCRPERTPRSAGWPPAQARRMNPACRTKASVGPDGPYGALKLVKRVSARTGRTERSRQRPIRRGG